MKLVIDIPEDDYKRIVKEGMTVFGSDYDIALLERALENSTPLEDFNECESCRYKDDFDECEYCVYKRESEDN